MASISPFNILLNNLSNELSSVNLQSLINVCGDRISESERERISSGWDVFKILIQRNAMGENPMGMKFLIRIVKELRPKRRDLVDMVKKYVEDHCEESKEMLNDLEFSSDNYRLISRTSMPFLGGNNQFNARWGCRCNCECNQGCSKYCCFVIIAMLLIFSVAAVAFLIRSHQQKRSVTRKKEPEYANGPDKGAIETSTVSTGPSLFWPVIITSVLLFSTACLVFLAIHLKRRKRKLPCIDPQSDIGDYGSLNSSTDLTESSSACTNKIARKNDGHRCSCCCGHMTFTYLSAPLCLVSAKWRLPLPAVDETENDLLVEFWDQVPRDRKTWKPRANRSRRQDKKRRGVQRREKAIFCGSLASFFNRIVDMRNTLPLPVRQATTISSFKKGVREFLAGNVWGYYLAV